MAGIASCCLLALFLSACATSPEQAQVNNEPVTTVTDTPADSQSTPEPAPVEYGQFSEDVLSRAIIAELAGQRGYDQQALDDYVRLAKETGDLNIIKRALRIAAFIRNVPAALDMGQMWLEQEPESAEANQTMAMQMISLGRYREALDHLVALLELGNNVDFRLITSRTAVDNNASLFLDALISDFSDLYTLYPDNNSLRLSLAHLYQQNGQIREAYDHVRELARDMDDSPEVVILEIQLLELLGEDRLARRRLQRSLNSNPENKQLRFLYARKLIDEQRYSEAKEQFTIIVDQNPRDFDMLYSLALISMEVNMFADARQYFERLVANSQRLDDAHYFLGYISAQENNNNAAIEHYLLVNSGSNFLQAQRNLTELMIRADRYQEARSHLQTIRFRNADYNIPLLTMEANVLMDEGKNDLAASVLNNAIGAFPNNPQLLFLRSILSQNTNNLELMEQDLRRVIQINPSSPVAYNSLGYILADRTDRYDDAYDLILRAVELAPNDPAIIDSLGWIQYKLGMYEEARMNLDRAYELFPDPEVAAHLGEVLWVMGQRTEANRIWQSALEVQPDSEHVLNAMERLTSDSDS